MLILLYKCIKFVSLFGFDNDLFGLKHTQEDDI